MGKESVVEIPAGSGNRYRYEYSEGKTLYRGPVGSAPELGEEHFMAALKQVPMWYNDLTNAFPGHNDLLYFEEGHELLVKKGKQRHYRNFRILLSDVPGIEITSNMNLKSIEFKQQWGDFMEGKKVREMVDEKWPDTTIIYQMRSQFPAQSASIPMHVGDMRFDPDTESPTKFVDRIKTMIEIDAKGRGY